MSGPFIDSLTLNNGLVTAVRASYAPMYILFNEGEDEGPPWGIPGQKGDTGAAGGAGAAGATGANGQAGPALLWAVDEAEDGWPIPVPGQKGDTGGTGSAGATGAAGSTGQPGPALLFPTEAEDDGRPLGFPGVKGDTGSTGNTGPAGTAGANGQVGPALLWPADETDEIPYWIAPPSPVEADWALTDRIRKENSPGAVNYEVTDRLGAFFFPACFGGRLTLTTGTWLTTSDVTAATTLYYTPGGNVSGGHNRCVRSDGTRLALAILSELSIKLTDGSQTGTTHNGTKVIDGLTDTSQLVRGMKVTGTNVGAAATVSSIDSATQVTVSVNSTGSASNTITFKLLGGNSLYDVFDVNGKLQLSNAWTSATVRNDALGTLAGITVNNAAINATDSNTIAAKAGVWLGTIGITSADGQTQIIQGGTSSQVGGYVGVWNVYNRRPRPLAVIDTTVSWATSTLATWRQANGAAGNKIEYVCGMAEEPVTARVVTLSNPTAGNGQLIGGVGVDVTNANSCQVLAGGSSSTVSVPNSSFYEGIPGVGYHYLAWLERPSAAGTFYGSPGAGQQTGLLATVWG